MPLKHRRAVFLLLTATGWLAATAIAAPDTPVGKETLNPVQKEMRLLEAAMQESVAAIAKGDVRQLPKRLHAVHMAGGDTSAALKSGSYKLPQQPRQVAPPRFRKG